MGRSGGKEYWADFSWNAVYMGACATMWQETGEDKYEKKMAFFANEQLNSNGNIQQTPKGLTLMNEWGPIRHAVGVAGIMALYARGLEGTDSSMGDNAESIMAFAEHQVCFIQHLIQFSCFLRCL